MDQSAPPVVQGQPPQQRLVVSCGACRVPLEFVIQGPGLLIIGLSINSRYNSVTHVKCYNCIHTTVVQIQNWKPHATTIPSLQPTSPSPAIPIRQNSNPSAASSTSPGIQPVSLSGSGERTYVPDEFPKDQPAPTESSASSFTSFPSATPTHFETNPPKSSRNSASFPPGATSSQSKTSSSNFC